MNKKVLINCSNLHTGGGVAVASSFLDCASKQLEGSSAEIHVLASSEVNKNLISLGADVRSFSSYEVKDFFGVSALWKGLSQRLTGYDVVFTVFGPSYDFAFGLKHIMGFAQPNIIYPDNPIFNSLDRKSRFYTRVKYFIQELFFWKASSLVVELDHVRRGLKRKALFGTKSITIVESAVHSVYSDRGKWLDLDLPEASGDIKLGIISRNYPHKNLKVLPGVKAILSEKYGLNVSFYVTFTDGEWQACNAQFRENIINVGGLRLAQCPTFYAKMDGVIFPSLLECFSAVPIEAMKVERPIFASDLDFIHDVCGSHAEYFDPLDEASIARSIYEYFELPEKVRAERVSAARDFVKRFPGPEIRARRYLELIENELNAN
ncbi:glycosyltransferase [Marinobacter sp. MA]|uniref:glycosyltransferase n=1 Tax=Marinobacter sp. MA TaxID=2971606 RepID=UPI003AAB36B6